MTVARRPGDAGRRAAIALMACFAAVAITFTLATVIAETASFQIHEEAVGITANSSPTIAYLSSIRGTIRQLQSSAYRALGRCDGQGCGAVDARITELLRRLDREWDEYRKLPAWPEEAETWPLIDRDLREIRDRIGDIVGALQGGDRETALRICEELDPVVDSADHEVGGIIQKDHGHAVDAAATIGSLARRSIVLAIVLDGVSLALTIVAAWLALRLVRREATLLRQRSEELDQFAGRVAHDILTPLWSIDAALYAASQEEGNRSPALTRAGGTVAYIQQLVRGLLEFARSGALDAPPDETADVRAVLASVVEQLGTFAERSAVVLHLDQTVTGWVRCSESVLSSIFVNLIGNAIKHMGTRPVRQVTIRRPVGATRGFVRVEIEDTGPGLERAIQDRIFDPFVRGTAESAGYGLGLTTVKRLVEASGGQIAFRSTPDAGTTFSIELPVDHARTTASSAHEPRRVADHEPQYGQLG